MTMIYFIMLMGVMLGFCSLAVDFGRVQAAKTQLRAATDAAALAAACALPQGNSAAQTAAEAVAAANKVDTRSLTLTSSNIVVGIWNTSTKTFSSSGTANNTTTYQAVQVTASMSKSAGTAIPLMFASILGFSTCNVTATSTVALISEPSSTTSYISAHGNPWLAGEPAGTKGSEPDADYNVPSANNSHPWKYDIANPSAVATAVANAGSSGNYTTPYDTSKVTSTDYSADEPYCSPTGFVVSVTPGSVIQVSIPTTSANTSNDWGYLNGASGAIYADGDDAGSYTLVSDDAANPSDAQGTTTTSGSEHGISNIIVPVGSVVGVFMDQNGATYGADSTQEASESNPPGTPSGLDFSQQSDRDYTTISPKLNQSFYVGTGKTSTGTTQTIVVPPNTYELFLGTMDEHEWSNNVGGFTATINQYHVEIVQ